MAKKVTKPIEKAPETVKKEPVIEIISIKYYLEFQSAELYLGQNFLRVVVVMEKRYLVDGELKIDREIVNKINDARWNNADSKACIANGFGVDRQSALADFIWRNKTEVLDILFDKSLERV